MTREIEHLRALYDEALTAFPHDGYLRGHAGPEFLAGTVRVFEFYWPWVAQARRVLDWGCRHAPDACLLRQRLGAAAGIEGCDFIDYQYPTFAAAGLHYTQLRDAVRLPYADGSFDTVIASGVLEHVPHDYESLKELWRVLEPKGRLAITYLPNRWSLDEALRRRRRPAEAHVRLYGKRELRDLLLHTGFRPLTIGYQTQIDLLPSNLGPARALLRALGAHRFTSCLCAVAERVPQF